MFVELHILQNFAPSNLNRDDTGSPKDCEFGGYRRARMAGISTEPVAAAFTSVTQTRAPAFASARTIAAPMPAPPPVTSARLSCSN